MFKKSKLHVAVSLMVQSVTMFVLFIILAVKKKSIAGAFLAVAAIEGSAGAYLLCQLKKEKKEEFDPDEALGEDSDNIDIDEADIASDLSRHDDDEGRDNIEIPKEDVVSTEEFDS